MFIDSAISSNNLPSEYTELEYIQSTGTQYINTGLTAADFDEAEGKINIVQQVMYAPLIAVSSSQSGGAVNGRTFRLRDAFANDVTIGYSDKWYHSIQELNTNTDYILDFIARADLRKISINNTTVYENQSVIVETVDNVYKATVFVQNYAGDLRYYGQYKLYYLKLKKINQLVMNLIPAKRNSDNVIGMYDTISNTFFTNAGTGTFVAGSEVVNQESENTEIKIATTKYVEDKFADSVSELNTTIGTIKNVVDNTIIQADRIGKLYTGKQNRPDDSSDSEKCPVGRDCLLITEADGTLHWYPICGADGSVEPLFVISTFLAQLTVNGDNYYFNGNTTTYKALGNTGSVSISQPSTDSIVRQLKETEWAVLWNNIGVVYGTSVCNGNSGTRNVASTTEQTETKGKNCWCKMTSVGDTDKVEHSVSGSAWVFSNAGGHADSCAHACAYGCAYYVQNGADFRGAVVGVGN